MSFDFIRVISKELNVSKVTKLVTAHNVRAKFITSRILVIDRLLYIVCKNKIFVYLKNVTTCTLFTSANRRHVRVLNDRRRTR